MIVRNDSSTWRSLRDGFVAWTIAFATLDPCFGADPPGSTNDPVCWPGFLGVGASPLLPETVPLQWSPTANIAWQTELVGAGQSSPIIWGDQVFVTTIAGKMKEACHVTALALRDGQIRWHYQTESAQPVRSNYFQSRSAPTPAVDATGVYAFFETGKVVALTHAGKEKWVRNLVDEYGEFEVRIGLAASVAQTATSVFVLVDHEGPSYLLALDKQSGQTQWITERFSRTSYASPIVLQIAGRPQIVISSAGSVDGYDPQTGTLLWTMEGVGGNRSTTPLPFGDDRFLISASPGMHDEQLDEARESNFALQVVKTESGYETKVLWKVQKAMPSFGSPMVHRGLAYWVNNVGVLYCFDAETGEMVFAKRSGQMCWATPFGLGDHVYLFGKDGLTTVIAAGREFKIVATNELIEGATAAGEAERQRRESRGQQHPGESAQPATTASETAAAGSEAPKDSLTKAPAANTAPVAHQSRHPGPAATEGDEPAENSAPRTRDGRTFADPVQYGYAAVNGSLIIRTGTKVYCVRATTPGKTVEVAQ